MINVDLTNLMQKNKQKIKLSESLQLGVSDPASQSTLYRTGGIVLTIFSLLLAVNIVRNMSSISAGSTPKTLATSQSVAQAVLGAYDQASVSTYTIQKGDTLFSIAQAKNVNWEIIAELNNMKVPYTLKPGTAIKVPVTK
jgi:LysM repeat protein